MNSNWTRSTPIVAFVCLFIGVLLVKIADYDLWWHLALGKGVLDTGSIFLPDGFSYTFAGTDQFNGEWLADVLMYLFYRAFDLQGIYLFKVIILGLVFYGAYRVCSLFFDQEQKGQVALAILSLIVVLFAIRFRLFIRPYLLSYLFFVYFLFVLNRAQRGMRGSLFWGLIPIGLLWANTSKGVFLGVLLLALYVADRLMKKQSGRADILVCAGVFIASLINPETWRVYALLLGFAGGDQALSLTGEQQPLTVQMLWGGGWSYTVCYQVLVVTGLVYLVFFKGWRNFFHLSSFVIFLGFSISLIRMIDFFSLLSGLFFFLSAQGVVRRVSLFQKIGEKSWSLVVGSLALLVLCLFVPGNQTYAFGLGVKEYVFPEKAVTFLRDKNIQGRLFNSYPFGGYLSLFLPEEKVFIDGRGYHLYPTDFQTNYLRSIGEQEIWWRLDKEWGFEVALLEYDLLSFGRHFARHLAGNPDWALVYWDEKSAVYLKRLPRFQDLINRYQYKAIRPNFYDFSYLNFLLKFQGVRLLELIDNDLKKNPTNQEVRLAKVYALYTLDRRKYREEIKEELLFCQKLYPDVAMEYSGLALFALEDKERESARLLAKKALSIDPADPGGQYVLEKLGE